MRYNQMSSKNLGEFIVNKSKRWSTQNSKAYIDSIRGPNDCSLGGQIDYWNGQKKSIECEPLCDDQPHDKNTFGLNLAFIDYGRKNKRHKVGIGFWNREKNESTKNNKNQKGYVSGGSGEVTTNNQSQCISLRARRSENYTSFVTEIEQGTALLNV